MRKFLLLSFVLAGLSLPVSAAGWEINGSFTPDGAEGLPRGWKYHTYSGYQPQAKIAVEQAETGNVLTISDVQGKSGAALMWSDLFAAASGDVVMVSGEFKGKGTASVDLNHYSVTRAWNQPKGGIASHPVKLTDDWRRHEFLMRISDGKEKTGFVKPVLACAKGATASFRNVTLEHRGTLRSGSWAFEPVRTLATEDFEDGKKSVRTGSPTVVSGIVSDGLLAKTQRGVFTTAGNLTLLTARGFRLASEDRLGSLRAGFRLYALSADAKLVVRLSAGGVRHDFEMPAELAATSLPADVVFRAGKSGEWVWSARSLVDGGTAERSGVSEALTALPDIFDGALVLTATDDRTVRTEIDNLSLAEDRAVGKPSDLPAIVTPETTFDPRTKGWKKVFEDEFEGPKGALFDTAKWYVPHWRKDNGCARLDGEGHLAIRAEFEPGTTNLQTSGIWSVPSWRYGFFEARVRFTRNNGWWAAFWLYGSSDRIASEDGAEIDIFEDYHTRRQRKPGQPAPIALDHNLHVSYQKDMKSYNRTSFTPGSIDDFHTIGCKWTPFEISLYMDGKLMSNATPGANPSSVTFDGFATDAICAPLHAIVSGQIMRKWGNRDLTGCTFPESYLVDWVRVWEYPTTDLPRVTWKDSGNRIVCEDGEELVLEVEAKGKAEIREAYLFDDGAYLMARTNPPWRFRFPFSKECYRDTRFAVPGRQGVSPDWDRMLHSFRVYVRDAEGRVGVTETPVRRLSSVAVAEAAGEKSVQTVPGRLRFGQNRTGYVREFHTGEVRTCEIEVAREGNYVGRFDYQSGNDFPNRVLVVVDGVLAATAEAPGAPGRDWKAALQTSPVRLRLTAGRHQLVFVAIGYLQLGAFTVAVP